MGTHVPFVNWAGGKSQLVSQMRGCFPKTEHSQRYIEPFVGGGAIFLAFSQPNAILGDSNHELINCYRVVRDNVEALMRVISSHIHNREHYYWLRGQDPNAMDEVSRAARFIYLNKTCYNGVYRVNLKGQFNVPFGNRKARIYDEDNLRRISPLLKDAELVSDTYEMTLARAQPGDFIYLDPPYHPLSRTSNFTKYTSSPFGEEDQIGLAKEFKRLTDLGCKVMLSNSDTAFVRELYGMHYTKVLTARRYVNCNGGGRKAISELLVMNYESPSS